MTSNDIKELVLAFFNLCALALGYYYGKRSSGGSKVSPGTKTLHLGANTSSDIMKFTWLIGFLLILALILVF